MYAPHSGSRDAGEPATPREELKRADRARDGATPAVTLAGSESTGRVDNNG